MLLFLTGEGRVLQFVPLLLGIFWCLLYDFVFIRDVLFAEIIAFFIFHHNLNPPSCRSSGWCGILTYVLGNTDHTRT